MPFNSETYGDPVASILALDGDGHRLMPLVRGPCSSNRARALLEAANVRELFPDSRSPQAALAGLYLYFSCWEEAHTTAQEISTPEGSYWHAIVHRQEPDPGNSTYWFRQVGAHPVFPALAAAAAAIGIGGGGNWDPFAFIQFCEDARRAPGSSRERQALEVQRAEWQLLFDFCAARPVNGHKL
jgi:hypothetical protein